MQGAHVRCQPLSDVVDAVEGHQVVVVGSEDVVPAPAHRDAGLEEVKDGVVNNLRFPA